MSKATGFRPKQRALASLFMLALVLVLGFHNCSGANMLANGPADLSSMQLAPSGPLGPTDSSGVPSTGSTTNRFGQPATGGGEGYDGLKSSFVAYTPKGAECSDGSNIQSLIQIDHFNNAFLVRQNCQNILPQLISQQTFQQVSGYGSSVIVFNGQSFFGSGFSSGGSNTSSSNFFCWSSGKIFSPLGVLFNSTGPSIRNVSLLVSRAQQKARLQFEDADWQTQVVQFQISTDPSGAINGTNTSFDQFKLKPQARTLVVQLSGASAFELVVSCRSSGVESQP